MAYSNKYHSLVRMNVLITKASTKMNSDLRSNKKSIAWFKLNKFHDYFFFKYIFPRDKSSCGKINKAQERLKQTLREQCHMEVGDV